MHQTPSPIHRVGFRMTPLAAAAIAALAFSASADAADAAYGSLDDTNNASANVLVNGVPTAGALSPSSSRPTWGSC